MTVLAHLSDVHFGTEDPVLVDALAAELDALAPALVVVSGDLTQRARREQYRAARAFLDRLTAPWVAVPGNHDIPLYDVARRALAPRARFRRYIGPVQTLHTASGLRVLALDTARPDRWKEGRVRTRHLPAIRVLGDGEPGDLRVLVGHHPFDRRGHEAAARARVDILMSGHLHLRSHGHVEVEEHGMLELQAGTALSRRRRGEPNSWNIVRRSGDELEVEVRDWDGGAFAPVVSARFHRAPRGWRPAS